MSTQLELDLPALLAIATSRDAAETIAVDGQRPATGREPYDGRRPGVTRLVVRNGQITHEPRGVSRARPERWDGMGRVEYYPAPSTSGFGDGQRFLAYDPIPGLRMTPADAEHELAILEDGWDE